MTDNTQELDEILFDLYQYRSSRPHSINQQQVMEKRRAILDWHNKQIEVVLDKLKQRVAMYELEELEDEVTTISTHKVKALIEAERNRLKSGVERLKELNITAAEIDSVEYFGGPPTKLKESE